MKGLVSLRKLAVVTGCLAVLCLPGYSEPTPEQIKERTELLKQAIENNNVEQAKVCIKLGADVNASCRFWYNENMRYETGPILASAVCRQNKDIVELLIKSGADVNAKCGNGNDSLLRVTARNDVDYGIDNNKYIADLLIKAGADINAKNKYGRTALRAAAMKGHKDIVELLIKAGVDVNAKASDGLTALIGVASEENGNKDIADLLIKAGSDVNARDNNGRTALMYALSNFRNDSGNYIDMVETLIKAGADGNAAFILAIDDNNDRAVKLLIELGADINATDSDGLTLLTHAILYGHNYIADLLRSAGAKE
ncbi:MAG: ankyrin repeat domain-containing protein [Treponemataceae bacterium]|nr:ankyrin repeat domain-containing protein [Treponemataceae bacterium]